MTDSSESLTVWYYCLQLLSSLSSPFESDLASWYEEEAIEVVIFNSKINSLMTPLF